MPYLTEQDLVDRYKFYTIQLESLLEQGEEFTQIGEELPVSIHKNNPADLRLLDFNDATWKFTGYSREELEKLGTRYFIKHMHPYFLKVTARKIVHSLVHNPGKITSFIQYLHLYGNEERFQPVFTFSKTLENGSSELLCISMTSQMFYKDKMPGKIERVVEMDEFKLKHFKQFQQLTDRERQILTLLAEGLNNPKIADRLFISRHTVETHRKHINHKLGIKHYRDVMKYALAFDLITIA